MVSVAALRQQLAALVPVPRTEPASGVIPTGIAALDGALSGGGLPRGRLTEVMGVRGSGATTLTRAVVAESLRARHWVAYVDGSRTLAPRDWAALGDTGRLWVVRPPDADRSAWCADLLLRSGAFGVVVLDGGPSLPRQVATRLIRLAQEHDAVLLVVAGEHTSTVVGGAVRLRVGQVRHRAPPGRSLPGGKHGKARVLQVLVEKGGRHQSVEVSCAIDVASRLCAHPEVPDRRGVASRNRRGERVVAVQREPGGSRPAEPERATEAGGQRPGRSRGGNGEGPGSGVGCSAGDGGGERNGATLPRKRRCAEPVVRRTEFLLGKDSGW